MGVGLSCLCLRCGLCGILWGASRCDVALHAGVAEFAAAEEEGDGGDGEGGEGEGFGGGGEGDFEVAVEGSLEGVAGGVFGDDGEECDVGGFAAIDGVAGSEADVGEVDGAWAEGGGGAVGGVEGFGEGEDVVGAVPVDWVMPRPGRSVVLGLTVMPSMSRSAAMKESWKARPAAAGSMSLDMMEMVKVEPAGAVAVVGLTKSSLSVKMMKALTAAWAWGAGRNARLAVASAKVQ